MMKRIEHIVMHTPVSQEVFTFWLSDRMKLGLAEYLKQSRPSARHNWKTEAKYSSTLQRSNTIKFEEVVVPASVIEQVRTDLYNQIQYEK